MNFLIHFFFQKQYYSWLNTYCLVRVAVVSCASLTNKHSQKMNSLRNYNRECAFQSIQYDSKGFLSGATKKQYLSVLKAAPK